MPAELLRPEQHRQLHVVFRTSWILLFANLKRVKGKTLTNFVSEEGSREKLQQLKERQLHSRNNSYSLSTGNKNGHPQRNVFIPNSTPALFFFPGLEETPPGFQENFTRVL